jgi:mannose-6-phosphate isomerase-like protein (cupin superfamily)
LIVVKCLEADRKALASINYDPEELEDDGIDYDGIRVGKPWGHEIQRYHNEKVAVWWLSIHAGQQTSMHCHPGKSTMLFVVSGIGTLHTLEKSYELSAGELVVIEKGAFHQSAANDSTLVLYEIETPPVKRDLIRLHDSYNRGQGYDYERIQPAGKVSATGRENHPDSDD